MDFERIFEGDGCGACCASGFSGSVPEHVISFETTKDSKMGSSEVDTMDLLTEDFEEIYRKGKLN